MGSDEITHRITKGSFNGKISVVIKLHVNLYDEFSSFILWFVAELKTKYTQKLIWTL